jgi:hypothetical protein
MSLRVRLPFSLTILSLALAAPEAPRAEFTEHRLTVAVSSELEDVADQDLDDAVVFANRALARRDQTWDVACDRARFRLARVVRRPGVPLSGELASVLQGARAIDPAVGVVVVENVTCPGAVNPIGCGQRGAEGFNLRLRDAARDGTLLAHERGHNMGLRHSVDEPERPEGDRSIARLMNPTIDASSTGLVDRECRAFGRRPFASTVAVAGEPPAAAEEELAAAAPDETPDWLTEGARRVLVDTPVEGVPIEVVLRLSPSDVESVRRAALSGDPELTLRAVNVLRALGRPADVEAFSQVIERAPPREQARDAGERARSRAMTAAKIQAAAGLADLALAGSQVATQALARYAEPRRASEAAGSAATRFRWNVLLSLAVVPGGEGAVQAAIESNAEVVNDPRTRGLALSAENIDQLRQVAATRSRFVAGGRLDLPALQNFAPQRM